MSASPAIFVLGDIHGYDLALQGLLRGVGLLGEQDAWTGGASTLWLLGDFVDQGPHGTAVLALVMHLQQQAAASAGAVHALLGNHDALLLAVRRFGDRPLPSGGDFRSRWLQTGGRRADLQSLTSAHERWLATLPLLAHVAGRLLAHADATFYGDYGASIDEVNAAVQTILAGDDVAAWERLLRGFNRHREFAGTRGALRLDAFLQRYGGAQLVHGHTPISKHPASHPAGSLAPAPQTVSAPLIYAGGRCVDVDGGIYLGGPGFIYRLAPEDV